MSDRHTHDDDQAVNNWLDRHQHTLDNSLDGVLDIEAGLREVLIHSRHDSAVDALSTVLDIEAGLADILPTSPQPRSPITHRHPRAGDSLPAPSPADRMALRDHPDVKTAKRALDRALSLNTDPRNTLVRDLALDLAGGIDRGLARCVARALSRALDDAIARDRDDAIARGRDPDRDLAHALRLARDLAHTVRRARTISGDIVKFFRDRVSVRARARDLADALDFARALDALIARALDDAIAQNRDEAIARALDDAIARGRLLDRDLADALARVRDLARALGRHVDRAAFIKIRTNEVCRAIGLALHREFRVLDAEEVLTLLDNFTHDDLRATDLRGSDLRGVHWSQHTQWPPVVDVEALKTRSKETPPGSGIWIIQSGTTTVRDLADLT
ncbi:hypothetical protein [Streptomyces virginiae]|uniref:hypothetical protein n=1 Tax=Streptomyces virginiae TaxID=1961 RepID=UPI00225C2446|nr:hypothetical protein [Streptomyces virginiae]MCX5278301.1 hypothetical protein [Streptomyces virginiae]